MQMNNGLIFLYVIMRRNIFIVLICVLFIFVTCFLCKLFVLPDKTVGFSKSIKQSQRIGAFVGVCRIVSVDTLNSRELFPEFKDIWVERPWEKARNKWGIISPMLVPDNPLNHILFKLDYSTYSKYSIFAENRYKRNWGIKDSLTRRIGYSGRVLNMDYHYNLGDTAVFTIYKLNEDDYWSPSIWNDDELIPYLRFKVVCE